jgi:hypothetical protein
LITKAAAAHFHFKDKLHVYQFPNRRSNRSPAIWHESLPIDVKYSSAPCGAGKTFRIARTACQMVAEGKNVLLLQPTKLLIEKTQTEEFDRLPDCPPIKTFHGGTVGNNVGRQLADYLAQPEDRPHIVLATHQVLPRIPYLRNANNWHLFTDECLQVDREDSHKVPNTHQLLTEHIKIDQCDGTYGRVLVANRRELEKLARNLEEDDLFDKFRETASILVNPHWDSFVNVELYHKLLAGKVNTLTFHSVLKASIINGFASVFMAGANFEDSGIYHLWGRGAVRFKPNDAFTDELRFRSHQNGHLATVHYALQRNWSRNLLKKESDGILNLDRMRDAAMNIIGSRPFLWQANKSVSDNFMGAGRRLPHNSLGLNDFSGVHDIVFLSALNPSPAHCRFLMAQGLTSEEIDRQGYCSTGYQAVMRTSLRDTSNLDPKNIVATDERFAKYICEILPGATLRQFETGIVDEIRKRGRPRIHKRNADKVRRHRKNEKETRAQLLNEIFSCNRPQEYSDDRCNSNRNSAMLRNENTISLTSNFVTAHQCFSTIYSHIKSTTPEAYLSCANLEAFVFAMAAFHAQAHHTKESTWLFSPAIFDPNRTSTNASGKPTKRGVGNIVYLQNIVLDFENGDLRPEEIAELFPDLQMIVTNTYRYTNERPRFRVIILTSQRMSQQVYEALFDAIVNKLKDAGFTKSPRANSNFKKSGLDYSKRSAVSLFYLPGQAEKAGVSFFEFYDEPHRHPLDPEKWVMNIALTTDVEPTTIQPDRGEVDQAGLESAIASWRKAAPGDGGRQFYLLAVETKKMGLSAFRIKAMLTGEARFGRSPAERTAQIPSIMSSLSKQKAASLGAFMLKLAREESPRI